MAPSFGHVDAVDVCEGVVPKGKSWPGYRGSSTNWMPSSEAVAQRVNNTHSEVKQFHWRLVDGVACFYILPGRCSVH